MSRHSVPSLKRSRASREPKTRFVVFCEGRRTEPVYLDAIRRAFPGALLDIEIVPNAGVPYTQAQQAVSRAKALGLSPGSRRKLDSFESKDQVWVVFDRDDHPRHSEAVQLCEAKGIGVARSNPCFELWLILHYADYDKPDDRHAVQTHLRSIRSEYDPSSRKWFDCTELVAHVECAERRAAIQLSRRTSEGAPHGPPSTTVFRLTQAIRAASERAR